MSGSETPQGPGWWQASDGRWYPPQGAQTPLPPPAALGGAGLAPPPSFAPAPGMGGFFSSVFDTSFKRFVTPSIVKVLFWIGVVLTSIYALVILIAFVSQGGGLVVLGLIAAPAVWLIGVLYVRVLVEVAIAFFRIEENTRSRD